MIAKIKGGMWKCKKSSVRCAGAVNDSESHSNHNQSQIYAAIHIKYRALKKLQMSHRSTNIIVGLLNRHVNCDCSKLRSAQES